MYGLQSARPRERFSCCDALFDCCDGGSSARVGGRIDLRESVCRRLHGNSGSRQRDRGDVDHSELDVKPLRVCARRFRIQRSLFARYDVEVITANPGAVARREMMLAGNAAQLGQPVGSLGVAPTGSASDNRIAFAFANDIGADPDKLCWVAAQQLGFLYALDYEFYCPDIMSASIGCGLKSFTDLAEPCGYDMATPTCPTGGQSTQNTAALLGGRAGLSDRIFLNEFELPRPAP
jgi:hypothetical protein